ncbi:MAG: DUF2267 domain-containing protein [Myxococcota bacterium]
MPMPAEYQRIRDHLYAFLVDAREELGLTSTHQSYTTSQGVFRVFRRRLTLKDAIRFSNLLPAGLRALFVSDWDVDEPRRAFGDRSHMTREVKALRSEHNFSPDTAIGDVARALRKNVDEQKLDAFLQTLGDDAVQFWSPDPR